MAFIVAASKDFEGNQSYVQDLERLGHQVRIAASAEAAWKMLSELAQSPDLMIIDVGLKEFGGREMVLDLRKSEHFKEIPILIQTRSTWSDVFERSNGVLQKPYSLRDLTRLVDVILANPIRYDDTPPDSL